MGPSPHRRLPAPHPAFLTATLSLGMAVSLLLAYALGVLGPFLTEDPGLSRAQLGSLTTVLFVVACVLSPVAGRMVDRLGARPLLVLLFLAASGGAAGAAAAPSYSYLMVAVGVSGLAVALGNPVTNQILAVAVEPARLGLLVGVKQSGVQVGAFAAGATLPALAHAVGWRAALLATASLGVAGVAATMLTVPPTRPPTKTASRGSEPLPSAVGYLTVYALLMGVGVGAVGAYLPLYAVERLAMTPAAGGFAAGLTGAVGIAARIVWGRRADRTPRPVHIDLGHLALGAVGAMLLVLAAPEIGPWALWVGAAGFGATAVAWNAVGMLAVVRGMPQEVAGRASGRILVGFYLGILASPISFGWSVDRTGSYVVGWIAVTVAFILAAFLMARGGHEP